MIGSMLINRSRWKENNNFISRNMFTTIVFRKKRVVAYKQIKTTKYQWQKTAENGAKLWYRTTTCGVVKKREW